MSKVQWKTLKDGTLSANFFQGTKIRIEHTKTQKHGEWYDAIIRTPIHEEGRAFPTQEAAIQFVEDYVKEVDDHFKNLETL